MKKGFIIFLAFILMLCSFNIAFAYNNTDSVSNIREQLDKISMNIDKNNINEAKSCLAKLREYVYNLASEMTKQNIYTSRVFEIINFSALAIENKDVEYIVKARMVLDEILSDKPVFVSKNNHS